MPISHDTAVSSTENDISLHGQTPRIFRNQRQQILELLVSRRGSWVPSYELAKIAPQYSSRVKDARDEGWIIENRTKRVGRQVHGEFRLVACPGEPSEGL